MKLYRAVSRAELDDIRAAGVLRPGPPSFMGKWFLTSLVETAEIGRRLCRIGNPPFHLIEIEVADEHLAAAYCDPFRDAVGVGYYFDSEQLDRLVFVREVPDVPTQYP